MSKSRLPVSPSDIWMDKWTTKMQTCAQQTCIKERGLKGQKAPVRSAIGSKLRQIIYKTMGLTALTCPEDLLGIKIAKSWMVTHPFKNNSKHSTSAETEAPWNANDFSSERGLPQITSKQPGVNRTFKWKSRALFYSVNIRSLIIQRSKKP